MQNGLRKRRDVNAQTQLTEKHRQQNLITHVAFVDARAQYAYSKYSILYSARLSDNSSSLGKALCSTVEDLLHIKNNYLNYSRDNYVFQVWVGLYTL